MNEQINKTVGIFLKICPKKCKLWRFPSAQVIFDDDPAPKDHNQQLQTEEMSNALIK